jgi:hypothetical protein
VRHRHTAPMAVRDAKEILREHEAIFQATIRSASDWSGSTWRRLARPVPWAWPNLVCRVRLVQMPVLDRAHAILCSREGDGVGAEELESEYTEKLLRLREAGGSAGIDAFLLSDWKHVSYVTGFYPAITSRPGHLLVSRRDAPILLVHGMLAETIKREHPYIPECRTYYRPADLFVETLKILEQGGLQRATVGIEIGFVALFFWRGIGQTAVHPTSCRRLACCEEMSHEEDRA